jgi:hypothetical protein
LSADLLPSCVSLDGLTVSFAGKSVFVAGTFFSGARVTGVIAVYVGDGGRAIPVSNISLSGVLDTNTRTLSNLMEGNESSVNGMVRICASGDVLK